MAVSTHDMEKLADEQAEAKVAKLNKAYARKKYGLPTLEEDVTSSLSVNIHVVVHHQSLRSLISLSLIGRLIHPIIYVLTLLRCWEKV